MLHQYPRGPRVLFGPPKFLEEPSPLVEPLHHLVVGEDLLAEHLVAPLAERHRASHQVVLLDEGPHHHVGEPQVVTLDGRASLLDAGGVEQLAAAGAGYRLLAGAVLAEPGVLGLGVRADGRDRDLVRADGATDGFGQMHTPLACLSGRLVRMIEGVGMINVTTRFEEMGMLMLDLVETR